MCNGAVRIIDFDKAEESKDRKRHKDLQAYYREILEIKVRYSHACEWAS